MSLGLSSHSCLRDMASSHPVAIGPQLQAWAHPRPYVWDSVLLDWGSLGYLM